MARLLSFRNLLLLHSHPFKSFSSSSLSPHSSETNASHSVTSRALHLLQCCKTSIHLFQIQSHLITSGLFRDLSFTGRLLKLSSNLINDLCYTLLIFKHAESPDAFCVNTVIKQYSSSSCYEEAVVFYVKMLRGGGFYPNGFTFPPLISACAKSGCLSSGRMCHGHIVKLGFDSVLPVQNSLIHFYAWCGVMDVAHKLFVEMVVRDLVSWNTVIDGFAKAGEMGLAHKLFDEMPERNVVSWNVVITGYLKLRSPGNSLKLFREMMGQSFGSNDTTMVQVITACGRSNRLKEGRSVHGFLIRSFSSLSLIIDTAIIDMYSKCGKVDSARLVFERMPRKNSVSWNAIILGHCIHGNPVEGLSLFAEMLVEIRGNDRLAADELTFIGVLCACARLGLLENGRNYFSQMIDDFGIKPNFGHYWCMANLMANLGLTEEAVSVLKNIPIDEGMSQESSMWAGLFGSCRFEGDVAMGEQTAKDLIEQDPYSFSGYNILVNVYAAAGKWEDVARVKEMMRERGIQKAPCFSLKELKEIVEQR
ncbi:pentatricopeptide repeat-containing protein At3g51320-like [Salvia splendens]|uniref:pentatricopeptide repeat-containing protein At3g51320-like n=1 Tax=Salvia splendens TaxID=180675 RepID=UPI001C2655FA|nr:pentatricopeptide repeat-containing protein At3g51320-like [Salvia splendens]XP_042017554.1 pentatricopeptide repeat-containing protein At3g51320-like [Salvia splendens]